MNRGLRLFFGTNKIVASFVLVALIVNFSPCQPKTNAVRKSPGPLPASEKRPIPRQDAFFGLHFDLHPNKTDTAVGADISEENIAQLLDRVRPDYVQYHCKGHAGYTGYPTKVRWPSPGIVKDSLAVWRKVTKEHSAALFIHYSGVWNSKAI